MSETDIVAIIEDRMRKWMDGPAERLARTEILRLRSDLSHMREALEKIAAQRYGMEICNSDADNLEIACRHLERYQGIARAALSPAAETKHE